MWARHNVVPGKPSSPHQHRSGAEYGILHVLSGLPRGYLPGYTPGGYSCTPWGTLPEYPWGSNPGGTPNQYPGYIFYPGIHPSRYPLACQLDTPSPCHGHPHPDHPKLDHTLQLDHTCAVRRHCLLYRPSLVRLHRIARKPCPVPQACGLA